MTFDYSYDKLFGNKSQCEICKNEKCPDVGKHSHYDGKKNICSRFEEHTKEQREELAREKRKKEEEDAQQEYWEWQRKYYGL